MVGSTTNGERLGSITFSIYTEFKKQSKNPDDGCGRRNHVLNNLLTFSFSINYNCFSGHQINIVLVDLTD